MGAGDTLKLKLRIHTGPAALSISGTPILSGNTGDVVSWTALANGGTPPYVFSVASGALAPGLSLNSSSGVVSGTLTTVGSYTAVIRVTDGVSATANLPSFTTTVTSPGNAFVVTLTPPTAAFTTGTAITTFTAAAVGASAPVTWTVKDPSYYPLPTGLALNPTTGAVTGTPTEDGVFVNCIIKGTDNLGQIGYSSPFTTTVHLTGATPAPAPTPYTQQRVDSFISAPGTNAVVSYQGLTYNSRNSSNPDPTETQYYGHATLDPDGPRTIPPDPVALTNNSSTAYPVRLGAIVDPDLRGGRFLGEVSLTADRYRLTRKKNTISPFIPPVISEYVNASGFLMDGGQAHKVTISRARIHATWDGIQGVPNKTPYQTSVYRELWITGIRDDGIEHDINSNGVQTPLIIDDCLVDGVFGAVSMDPGGTNHPDNSATLCTITDCIFVLSNFPTSTAATGDLHDKSFAPFKVTSLSSSIAISGSIVAAGFDTANVTASDKSDMHSRYVNGWAKMTTSAGNMFLWTSDLPMPSKTYIGEISTTDGAGVTGWTVQTGATARATLAAAREAWVVAHPYVHKLDTYTPGS
jgi:hypothetical protein